MGTPPTPEPLPDALEHVITRAERAHWRLTWRQRLLRNARLSAASPLTLTLHGLPTSFAYVYGFPLLDTA